jgi:Rrf2 family protein
MVLHVLLHMAEQDEAVTSEVLGTRMKVNPVVIRRTFAGLRNSKLVEAVKGHGGGWRVARPLSQISLLDVYRALGEPLMVMQHQGDPESKCLVEQTVGRALNESFAEAEALLIQRFGQIKLGDLTQEFNHRWRNR